MSGTTVEVWTLALTKSSETHQQRCHLKHNTMSCELQRTEDAVYTSTHQRLPPRPSDSSSLVASLRACARNKDLHRGIALHDEILQKGLLRKCSDALITMYAKCGAFVKAQELLNTQKSKSLFAWTVLISGYAQMGQGQDALECYDCMQREGIPPDVVTFTSVLKACGLVKALGRGRRVHHEIARQGLLANDLVLGNALVDMYTKCGALAQAKAVFEDLPSRDIISWNVLIAGYAQQEQSEQALECFDLMQHTGLLPDAVTYACALKACSNIGASKVGQKIHKKIEKQGILGRNLVLGTALVDMYAKCGTVAKARQLFEELPARDVVSWSALITGYAQQGQAEEALDCFEQMRIEGNFPDAVTFACILKVCGNVGAVVKGGRLHDEIARQGLLSNDIVLGNALVDMYVKCGALTKAQQVLTELPRRDAVTWNALISGYVRQGEGKQVLHLFNQMQSEGLSPNAATFSFVLNVCSHLGLVENGHAYFVSMKAKYGIKPNLEHYSSMVDLFGNAGHLDKAVGIMKEMLASDPSCPSGCSSEMGRCRCFSTVWCTLLKACHKWQDVAIGRWAFEQATQANNEDVAFYEIMANIYEGAGMKEDAKSIEAMRLEKTVCIDLSGYVQPFVGGEMESAKREAIISRQT